MAAGAPNAYHSSGLIAVLLSWMSKPILSLLPRAFQLACCILAEPELNRPDRRGALVQQASPVATAGRRWWSALPVELIELVDRLLWRDVAPRHGPVTAKLCYLAIWYGKLTTAMGSCAGLRQNRLPA